MQTLDLILPATPGQYVNNVVSGEVVQVVSSKGILTAKDDHGNHITMLSRGSYKLQRFGKLDISSSVGNDDVILNIGTAEEWALLTPEVITDWTQVVTGPYFTGTNPLVITPAGKRFRLKGFTLDVSLLVNNGGGGSVDNVLTLYDGATPIFVRTFTMPSTTPASFGPGVVSLSFLFPGDEYYLSRAANNALFLDISYTCQGGGGVIPTAIVDFI